MDDENDLKEDLRVLEALEASGPLISQRTMTRKERHRFWWGRGESPKAEFDKGVRRRDGQEPWIDLYNRLAAQYGPDITDRMVEGGFDPHDVFATWTKTLDDLDLWLEATGEITLLRNLGMVEQLGLECWLWETHDRQRHEQRYKPNKSPEHDAPWPGAPAKWAPRRWFCECLFGEWSSGNPLEISIARARARETADRLIWEDWEPVDERTSFAELRRRGEAPPESVLLQTPPGASPGAWALRHVAAPADALSARRRRLRGARALMRERLPDDDDLDRLATSAAIEAA